MNIMAMMKQAQQVQSKLQDVQARLAAQSYEGTAGGSAVKIVLSGAGKAQQVSISEAAMADREMLEDLIKVAINDAKEKAEAESAAEMKKAMGGVNLPPGLQLPF